MLVDAHVHLLPDRLIEAIRAWFDTHAWPIRYRMGVAACVAELSAGGTERMVALPYVHKPGMAVALNAFTLEIARAHPEVVPCCTVFPGEEGAERILDEALGGGPGESAGAFHGIKLHCHVMRMAPDDARMDAAFAASARHRKPLVIHCGPEPAAGGYGIDTRTVSGAARLARALRKNPEAIAIVPHLGCDEYAQFEALLDEFPNLYLDTAMVVGGYFPEKMRPDLELVRRRPGRILYGTDFPNIPYEWHRERSALQALNLPHETAAQLFGATARRLFAIE